MCQILQIPCHVHTIHTYHNIHNNHTLFCTFSCINTRDTGDTEGTGWRHFPTGYLIINRIIQYVSSIEYKYKGGFEITKTVKIG